jgi:hypothetical protein
MVRIYVRSASKWVGLAYQKASHTTADELDYPPCLGNVLDDLEAYGDVGHRNCVRHRGVTDDVVDSRVLTTGNRNRLGTEVDADD